MQYRPLFPRPKRLILAIDQGIQYPSLFEDSPLVRRRIAYALCLSRLPLRYRQKVKSVNNAQRTIGLCRPSQCIMVQHPVVADTTLCALSPGHRLNRAQSGVVPQFCSIRLCVKRRAGRKDSDH